MDHLRMETPKKIKMKKLGKDKGHLGTALLETCVRTKGHASSYILSLKSKNRNIINKWL